MATATAIPSTEKARLTLKPWHLVNALVGLILLAGLSGYPLLDPDEGRYGEIPREMLEKHDFVTPTLNYAKYFEKPPLLYWMTAASMAILGETEAAVRLPIALTAVAGLFWAWWLGYLAFGTTAGRWGPGVLGSSIMYFVVARTPIIDMLFSVTLAATFTAWWAGYRAAGKKRAWLYVLCGVFLGLATLAKGPTALLLFGAVVFLYLLWARQFVHFFYAALVPILTAVVVNLPWYISVQRANPEFLYYFIVVQHIQRFLGSAGRVEHAKPFYYFFMIAIPGCFIWSVFWPGMFRSLRRGWSQWPTQTRQAVVFLLLWAAVIILFFSASTCKLAQYILPAWWALLVPVAAWLPARLGRDDTSRGFRIGVMLSGLIMPAAILIALVLLGGHGDTTLLNTMTKCLSMAIMAVAVVLPLCIWRVQAADWRMGMLVAAAILPLAGLIPIYRQIAWERDMSGLIPQGLYALPKNTPWTIAQYHCYNQTLGFYTHQRIILIDHTNEIGLGKTGVDGKPTADGYKWFREGEQTIAELSARGPLALVTPDRIAHELARKYKLVEYKASSDRVIMFNQQGWEALGRPMAN